MHNDHHMPVSQLSKSARGFGNHHVFKHLCETYIRGLHGHVTASQLQKTSVYEYMHAPRRVEYLDQLKVDVLALQVSNSNHRFHTDLCHLPLVPANTASHTANAMLMHESRYHIGLVHLTICSMSSDPKQQVTKAMHTSTDSRFEHDRCQPAFPKVMHEAKCTPLYW